MNKKITLAVLTSLIATAIFAEPPPVGSANMQKLQKEYTDKGVVWLTIDSNAPGTEGNLTPEQAQKVATSWKTQQTALLLDPDGKVGRAYGAKNTPQMVIINPDGKIA